MPAALAPINPAAPLSLTGRADPPRKRRLTTTAEASMRRYLLDDAQMPNWPEEVTQAMSVCTRKQSRFAILRALGVPLVSAYRQVYDVAEGRADDALFGEASLIGTNQKVLTVINYLSLWLDNRWLKDNLEVRDYLLDLTYEQSHAAADPKDRLAAAKLLASITGQLVKRSEVIHRDGSDIDRQDELARAMLACIQSSLPHGSVSSSDVPIAQLASGTALCSRCQAEIPAEPEPE